MLKNMETMMETTKFKTPSNKVKAPLIYDDPYEDDPLLKITSQPDGSKSLYNLQYLQFH